MALDGEGVSNMIIPKPQSLFEIFDHLFDLPALGIIFHHIQGTEMKVRRDKITRFLPFFFHHDDSDLPQALDNSNKSGDLEGFVFTIDEEGKFSIGRT
jgi:hypothetical protein